MQKLLFSKVTLPTCEVCKKVDADVYKMMLNTVDNKEITFCRSCLNVLSNNLEAALNLY